MQEMHVQSLNRDNPLEKEAVALSNGKSHGQRSLMGHIPRGSQKVGHNLGSKPQKGLYMCLLYQLTHEFSSFVSRFRFLVPCLTHGKHIIHICGVDKSINEKLPALCSEAPSTVTWWHGYHLLTCDLNPAWLWRGLLCEDKCWFAYAN